MGSIVPQVEGRAWSNEVELAARRIIAGKPLDGDAAIMRDEVARQIKRVADLESALAAERSRVNEAERERGRLSDARQELGVERDMLKMENEQLRASLDTSAAEVAQARAERDAEKVRADRAEEALASERESRVAIAADRERKLEELSRFAALVAEAERGRLPWRDDAGNDRGTPAGCAIVMETELEVIGALLAKANLERVMCVTCNAEYLQGIDGKGCPSCGSTAWTLSPPNAPVGAPLAGKPEGGTDGR